MPWYYDLNGLPYFIDDNTGQVITPIGTPTEPPATQPPPSQTQQTQATNPSQPQPPPQSPYAAPPPGYYISGYVNGQPVYSPIGGTSPEQPVITPSSPDYPTQPVITPPPVVTPPETVYYDDKDEWEAAGSPTSDETKDVIIGTPPKPGEPTTGVFVKDENTGETKVVPFSEYKTELSPGYVPTAENYGQKYNVYGEELAAFEKKWADKIDGENFNGTETEFTQYMDDYNKIIAKHGEIESYRVNLETQQEKERLAFEKDLEKSNPDLYQIYKTQGVDAYVKEVEKRIGEYKATAIEIAEQSKALDTIRLTPGVYKDGQYNVIAYLQENPGDIETLTRAGFDPVEMGDINNAVQSSKGYWTEDGKLKAYDALVAGDLSQEQIELLTGSKIDTSKPPPLLEFGDIYYKSHPIISKVNNQPLQPGANLQGIGVINYPEFYTDLRKRYNEIYGEGQAQKATARSLAGEGLGAFFGQVPMKLIEPTYGSHTIEAKDWVDLAIGVATISMPLWLPKVAAVAPKLNPYGKVVLELKDGSKATVWEGIKIGDNPLIGKDVSGKVVIGTKNMKFDLPNPTQGQEMAKVLAKQYGLEEIPVDRMNWLQRNITMKDLSGVYYDNVGKIKLANMNKPDTLLHEMIHNKLSTNTEFVGDVDSMVSKYLNKYGNKVNGYDYNNAFHELSDIQYMQKISGYNDFEYRNAILDNINKKLGTNISEEILNDVNRLVDTLDPKYVGSLPEESTALKDILNIPTTEQGGNITFEPRTGLETKILTNARNLRSLGVTEEGIKQIQETLPRVQSFYGKKSPYMNSAVLTDDIETLSSKGVETVLQQAVKDADIIDFVKHYGSSTMRPQINPAYVDEWIRLRGKLPGDIDVQLGNVSQETAEGFAQRLAKALNEVGENVYVDPSNPTLIVKRLPDGGTAHAVDIHRLNESGFGSTSTSEGGFATQSYGLSKSSPAVEIDLPGVGKVKLARLSETGVGKTEQVLGWRYNTETGQIEISPASHRMKDYVDLYEIIRTYSGEAEANKWANGIGFDPEALAKTKSFSEYDWEFSPSAGSKIPSTGSYLPVVKIVSPGLIEASTSVPIGVSSTGQLVVISPSLPSPKVPSLASVGIPEMPKGIPSIKTGVPESTVSPEVTSPPSTTITVPSPVTPPSIGGIDLPDESPDVPSPPSEPIDSTPTPPSTSLPSPDVKPPSTVVIPPFTPSLVTPSPKTPSPITPSPLTPSPMPPSPYTPSPVTPSPYLPSPVLPSPKTPSPKTPSPRSPMPYEPSPKAYEPIGKIEFGGEIEKKTPDIYSPITWKQGFVYWTIYPPKNGWNDEFGEPTIKCTRSIPYGAYYTEGTGSAYRTIKALGGNADIILNIDMGAFDVTIESPSKSAGKKGAIKFKRDKYNMNINKLTVKGVKITD